MPLNGIHHIHIHPHNSTPHFYARPSPRTAVRRARRQNFISTLISFEERTATQTITRLTPTQRHRERERGICIRALQGSLISLEFLFAPLILSAIHPNPLPRPATTTQKHFELSFGTLTCIVTRRALTPSIHLSTPRLSPRCLSRLVKPYFSLSCDSILLLLPLIPPTTRSAVTVKS